MSSLFTSNMRGDRLTIAGAVIGGVMGAATGPITSVIAGALGGAVGSAISAIINNFFMQDVQGNTERIERLEAMTPHGPGRGR